MSGLNSAAAPRFSSPSPDDAPQPAARSGNASPDTLNDLAVQLCELLKADGIAIAFREDGGFVCRGSAGEAPGLGSVIEPGVGFCGKCIQQARTVVEQQMTGELGSLVAIPLIQQQEVAGCVAAFALRRQAFSNTDIEQLAAIASHLGNYRKGDATIRQAPESVRNEFPFTPAEAIADDAKLQLGEPYAEEPSFAPDEVEDTGAGEHELGAFSTIALASVAVLLVLGLVSLLNFRQHLPGSASSATAPAVHAQPPITSSSVALPVARPASTPKTKSPDAPRPMLVENNGVTPRKTESDVEPPPVALQTATVAPDIPIVVSSSPTLAPSVLPHAPTAGSFREARLVRRVTPKFPDLAKSANMSGDVELEVTVSERGDVSGVWVIRGPAVFVSSAMDAVKQWRYVPAQKNGKNVESKVRLNIRFTAKK